MGFFRAILVSALLAGITAGLLLTGLQSFKVYPLIFAAEAFEDGDHGHQNTGDGGKTPAHGHHEGDAAHGTWAPADGGERLFYSALSNVLLSVAFALVLAAIFSLRGVSNWRRGAVWGLCGFIAVNLAPAAGLPPELPGMPVAGLLARQAWWWSTMVCTAGGLALLFLSEAMLLRALGVAVMALPHVYGAPHPTQLDSAVPAALAAQFATASLATNLVFWIILGVLTAEIMRRAHPDRGEEAATG